MTSGKHIFPICKTIFFFYLILCLAACEHSPDIGPQPLTGFFEKVTALVTTTVRGQLRDNILKQQIHTAQLPSFEKMTTMIQLTDHLKTIGPLKDLAYLIEMDIMFELQKPENHRERINFNNPEIQRELVSAILAGMKRALDQLKGGKGVK